MDLPKGQSAFLWGARKTGKSTYLRNRFPEALYYDLLQADRFLQLSKAPQRLREELDAHPIARTPKKPLVILDEVQKVPLLLDEVQWLIENRGWQFILCGSSARKLKRGQANLLGGRAWRYTMQPLCSQEIDSFDLLKALNHGLVPSHYLSPDIERSLSAYVTDYLTEEIKAEALVRNVAAFASFFDALAFGHGQLTNYSAIARECGVDSKTVKEYYQILVETLLGEFLLPLTKREGRRTIAATPKFYLFDVGVASHICHRRIDRLRGDEAGRAFEHFILMELWAYRAYQLKGTLDIHFWRTKTGLEVDFVLRRGEIAIEVKIDDDPDKRDIKGLIAFCDEWKPKRALVVCQTKHPRRVSSPTCNTPIEILPWKMFLEQLWSGNIVER